MQFLPNTSSNYDFLFIAKKLGSLCLQLFLGVHVDNHNIFLENGKYLSHS